MSLSFRNESVIPKPDFPVLGIIFDTRGIPPFISVSKVWTQTVQLLASVFQVHVYHVDTFEIDCARSEYRAFIAGIDLLILLSPYYSIDRTVTDIPIIVYALGSLQKGGHWLYRNRSSFRVCDSLLLNCSTCESIFHALVGKSAMKSYIVPLAIDPESFHPRGNKSLLRQKYHMPAKPSILIYSGRINLQKNCHLLLSILREVRKKHNAHLVLVGFFDNFYIAEFSAKSPPDSKAEFEKLLDLFDLVEHVSLIEHQRDASLLAEILSAADIGINVSTFINENFGLAPIEMQACGIPVVCTDWGGMRDTIKHGKTGFRVDTMLTDYGPRVHFEQAVGYIEKLLSSPKLRKRLSRNAVQHAAQYMFPAFLKRFCEVISDTLLRAEQREYHNDFVYHPDVEKIYEILQSTYGNQREIIWEHLHPSLDFEHYRLIVSRCATYQTQDLTWTTTTQISKAFDWTMRGREHLVSFDPRWNTSFELVDLELTETERELLWQIEHRSRRVGDLGAHWRWHELRDLLQSLARKGFILHKERHG